MFKVPTFEGDEFEFQFETPDGVTYSIPKVQYVPLPVMEAASARGGVGFVEIMREIDVEVGAAVASMSAAQLRAVEKAWLAESSSTVGESSASAS